MYQIASFAQMYAIGLILLNLNKSPRISCRFYDTWRFIYNFALKYDAG